MAAMARRLVAVDTRLGAAQVVCRALCSNSWPLPDVHAHPCTSRFAPQALLLELQGCREDVAQLGEVQRRAAELAEENRQLQARWAPARERSAGAGRGLPKRADLLC